MNVPNNSLNLYSTPSLSSNQGKVMKIILAILAVIIIAIGLLFYFTSGLTGVANEQLSAIKSGNIEAAYGMTSSAFQKETSIENFKSYVEKYPILKNYKSVSFSERKFENSMGYISGVIEDTDGSKLKIEYQLIKEDGKWKIQGMRLSTLKTE
jgi:hypothetical protein